MAESLKFPHLTRIEVEQRDGDLRF